MSAPNPLSERLRFAEFVLDRLPNGRCRARVGLTWKESEQFTGENEGLGSQAGELRCAAQACVDALTQAVQGDMSFELLGVKAVRAFDATVVIVSLAVSLMIANLMLPIVGYYSVSYQEDPGKLIRLGGIALTRDQVIVIAMCAEQISFLDSGINREVSVFDMHNRVSA